MRRINSKTSATVSPSDIFKLHKHNSNRSLMKHSFFHFSLVSMQASDFKLKRNKKKTGALAFAQIKEGKTERKKNPFLL